MIVRKTKRVMEMTAGLVGCSVERRSTGGGAFGRGWCGVAAAVLGTLAMIASVRPAAGQGGQSTSVAYKVPSVDYRPLALAYLSARYVGDFKGRASDFRSGPISPGTSIHARFLKAQTEYPWEGIPLGLFLRESQLTVGEGTVGLGDGKPLNMALYAFLDDMKVRYSVRVRTFDSDAWRQQPDNYSVLSDTTFFLQTDVPPPFAFVTGAYIACVNERSGSAGNSSNPACKESEGGQVIEDPLSETGEPALLMVGRSGLPEWLTEVPTDVCAAEPDPSKLPKIAVPKADGRHQEISLEKSGSRWCIQVTNLNYVACERTVFG